MKPCRKCGATERYKSGDCKPCARARAIAYQAANIEARSAYKNQWAVAKRKKDPEAARAGDRKYAARHRESKRAYSKAYYASHPEYWREWAKANREKRRKAYRRWLDSHPEDAKAAKRKWRQANPEAVKHWVRKRRARKAGAAGSHTVEQAERRFLLYGGKCWICRRRAGVQMDHVIALCNGGSDWPSNLRPACAKCNGAKGNWEMVGKKTAAEIISWASAMIE